MFKLFLMTWAMVAVCLFGLESDRLEEAQETLVVAHQDAAKLLTRLYAAEAALKRAF